jgi:hypothetical protein
MSLSRMESIAIPSAMIIASLLVGVRTRFEPLPLNHSTRDRFFSKASSSVSKICASSFYAQLIHTMPLSRPQPALLSFLYPPSSQCLRFHPHYLKLSELSLRPSSSRPRALSTRKPGRHFSTTSTLSARGGRQDGFEMKRNVPAEPSMKLQMKGARDEYMKSTLDMGLMDEIFIKPTGRMLPRFFGGWDSLKDRVHLEFHAVKARFFGFLA